MNREDWETLPGSTKFNSPLTNEVGKFLPFRSPLLPRADRSVAKQLRLRGGTPIAEVFSTVKSFPKPAVFEGYLVLVVLDQRLLVVFREQEWAILFNRQIIHGNRELFAQLRIHQVV